MGPPPPRLNVPIRGQELLQDLHDQGPEIDRCWRGDSRPVREGSDSGKHYLGRDEDWDAAETALLAALAERDIPHRRMEGEAAF